jgi:hypothetical protein
MSKTTNVLIPIPLVKQIIELLGYWDTSKYDRAICDDYRDVMQALNVKLQKLELRDAYSKIINAKNDDSRHDARMEYLWQKSRLDDWVNDGFIF